MNRNGLVGREWLLSELHDWFQNGGKQASLVGPPGIGKSAALHAFAQSIPETMVVDFSLASPTLEWPAELTPAAFGGHTPKLLILDSVESAPPAIWRSRRLAFEFPETAILYSYRPGVHHESLQKPGAQVFELVPSDERHSADLERYLETHGLSDYSGYITTFREAEFLAVSPEQGLQQLAAYYLALWRETTRPHSGTNRVLMEQLGLLFADTPEPLPFSALSDFTGVPLVQILEAMDKLSPLLVSEGGNLTLFTPGLSAVLRNTFSRDLGAVHGRIVSFFRDTYQSWQEMHDPYGWQYLVLHCDRLARATRRKDFSVLHWLNEGSFSQLKLERTGMLPSVLKDLTLSLVASLETDDLPRIVSFGSRLATLRKRESVRTVHRLADAGHLWLAQENGHLIAGETQRFLVWLLFATQTLEQNLHPETQELLRQVEQFATVDLSDLEVELAASLIGGMLAERGLPDEIKQTLESLLTMGSIPYQACLALKTVIKHYHLPRAQRRRYITQALEFAHLLDDPKEQKRQVRELESRLARISKKAPKEKAYPLFLKDAEDPKKEFKSRFSQARRGALPLSALAASLIPVSDQEWVEQAFIDIIEAVSALDESTHRQQVLAALLQSLDDAHPKDLPTTILDGLSEQILKLEEAPCRVRYLGRFAVLLSHKGRPLEASQRISLAAATAFGIPHTIGRADALLCLAEKVATTGAIERARDLSFHALELRSLVPELHLESQQLVRLLGSATAHDNQSAEEIVRLGSNLRFEDTPTELEAKGRALVVLASGLSRLGSEHHAKLYRSKAAEAVRSIDDLSLRVHLLCDLAAAFHNSGEEKEARRLIKEARGLFDERTETQGLLTSTALLKVYMAVENKTQTRRMFKLSRQYLEENPHSEWLNTPAFLELLYLAQKMGRVQEILPVLTTARRMDELSDNERLGVLRIELRLQNFGKAQMHIDKLEDIVLRCQAHIDMATSLLGVDHKRALQHLREIPLESYRCAGIHQVALLNSSDIRPTHNQQVREVLCELTLMAAEHPDAMDSVLSRWIQACPDRETIQAVADKMNWSSGQTSLFRQSMEAASPLAEEPSNGVDDSIETTPPEVAEEPDEVDDGFQVVSLTEPK